MESFSLETEYKLIEDQKRAVERLSSNILSGVKYQVLLGVTGSGKTFTIANVIKKLNMPTLVLSHNKTLAAQLYQEFRDFFPGNAVSYFVSYYDYYQPEAYIPSTDTYIEKDSDINELIDKLRLNTTANLLSRNDVIVVASVSCIYNIGSPNEYEKFTLELEIGSSLSRENLIEKLISLQYERNDFDFKRGTFRMRGENIDIFPAYKDDAIRIRLSRNQVECLEVFDPISGQVDQKKSQGLTKMVLYPAKHFIADPERLDTALRQIENDLEARVSEFMSQGKYLEAQRISQRVKYDLEMIREIGYVKGIENYSRYFDGRKAGEAPFTLLDYFNKSFSDKWLLVVDESHITFPQVRGMYAGDISRKKTLIDYGFRLPAALDNRPLTFDEFLRRIPRFIATSATPDEWELSMAKKEGVVEQLVRPTGIPDPIVEIRPTSSQVTDVIEEIKKTAKKGQRTLVTTLTKRMAEELSKFLQEKGIVVNYLHSDIETLERSTILDDLRRGKYDVIVGVNLLREGLDLPEVSLVVIMDADKEGFLRSKVSLIQTMGRAARHLEGRVILYADTITKSMREALEEIERRRKYQISYNRLHKITPTSIVKPIREKLVEDDVSLQASSNVVVNSFLDVDVSSLTPGEKRKLLSRLQKEMKVAASNLEFELAIEIRETLKRIKESL